MAANAAQLPPPEAPAQIRQSKGNKNKNKLHHKTEKGHTVSQKPRVYTFKCDACGSTVQSDDAGHFDVCGKTVKG